MQPREGAIQSPRLFRLLDTLGWLLMVAVPFGVVTLVARDTSIWARALEVGAVVGLVAAFLARRRWQRLTDEVRERLDTLDRCTPDLLFETDPRGVITFANHCSTSILGYTPEELVGKSLRGLTEGAIPLLDTVTPEDGGSATWNTRWMRADGDRVMLTSVLTSARTGGAPHGVRGVVRAQQDRLETEVELRDSEERFRAALDTTRNGLMLVANDGRLLMANQALRTLLGRTADEMAHLTVNDVVPGVYVDQFVSLMTSRM